MSIYIIGKKNITFLHIPKTAGTSILDWLRLGKGDSASVEWESHPKLSTIYHPGTFSFTVVRNPWDRMVSAYHYLKNISLFEGSNWLKINDIDKNNFPSFNEWIRNLPYYKNPDIYWFRPETPQMAWLDQSIDLILRFETLREDFKYIQNYFDYYKCLPKKYVTDHTSYRDYYNSETKCIVEKLSQSDIDNFKYLF